MIGYNILKAITIKDYFIKNTVCIQNKEMLKKETYLGI